MNRKYFAYAIIAILIAFSIGMLAISLGVHFSSAPVEAATLCALGSFCGRAGLVSGSDSLEHLATCAAGHRYWSCTEGFRVQHVNCRAPAPTPAPAPAPTPAPAPAPAPTPASRAQTPSQPVQTPPASPQQQSCTAPTVHFKTWTVGGPYDPGSAKQTRAIPKDTSFITNTETTCKVYAEVTYNGSQSSTTCELTGVSFNVKMSHSFAVSGTPTVTPSGSGFSTVWTYEATLTGPNSSRRSGPRCDHNNRGPGRPRKIDYPARNQTLMWMTLDFTGTYAGGTVKAPTVTLNQSTRDGIRQEYVDFDMNVVPDRSHFKSGPDSIYNWGHYNSTMDEGLAAMRAAWASQCVNLTKTDFVVTSGYRHPYHNHRCVRGVSVSKTKRWHGLHQYGCALDISGKIVYNEDGTLNYSKTTLPDANGSGKPTPADREYMEAAAKKAGAHYTNVYSSGHVHADWRPTDWIPAEGSRLGPPRTTKTKTAGGGSGGSGGSGGGSGDSGGSGDTAPAAPAGNGGSGGGGGGGSSGGGTIGNGGSSGGGGGDSGSSIPCPNGICRAGKRQNPNNPHYRRCANGHMHWSCGPVGRANHQPRTCNRCGNTFLRCSNETCTHRGRTYSRHW